MNVNVLTLCGLLSVVVFIGRALPFIFTRKFGGEQLENIGKMLPAYIMLLLVIYEINIEHFFVKPYALPELLSLTALTIVHLWQRQVLLSMFVGASSFMMLSRLIG